MGWEGGRLVCQSKCDRCFHRNNNVDSSRLINSFTVQTASLYNNDISTQKNHRVVIADSISEGDGRHPAGVAATGGLHPGQYH